MSESPSKGYILIARADRLGGRLIAMFHGIRMAQMFDLPYRITWPSFHDFEINNYWELFSKDYIKKHFVANDADPDLPRQTLVIPLNETIAQRVRDGVVLRIDPTKFVGDLNSAKEFDFFGSVGFHPDILQQMNEISGIGGFEALHLRYGDLLSADRVYSMSVPMEYYFDFLDNFDFESKKLILFGDNPDLQKHLASIYPVTLADEVYRSDGVTDLQKAFMEVYLLSAAEKITMGGVSAFSTIAASLGGCSRKVLRSKVEPLRKARIGQKIVTRLGSGETTYPALLGQDLPFHTANYFLSEHEVTPIEKSFLIRNVYHGEALADMPKFAKIDRLLMALDPMNPTEFSDLYQKVRPTGHIAPERRYGDFDQDAVLDLFYELASSDSADLKSFEKALSAAKSQNLLFNMRRTLRPSAFIQGEILGRWLLNCCNDPKDIFDSPIWRQAWPAFKTTPDRIYQFGTLQEFRTFFLITTSALAGCFNSAKHLDINALPWAGFDDILNGMDDLDPNAQFVVMAAWMATHCHRKDPEMHSMVAALRERHGAVLSRLSDHCGGLDNRFGKNLERIQNMGL